MFFRKNSNNNIKYNILVPPFDRVPAKMAPDEVKQYFTWYVSQVPLRSRYLSGIIGLGNSAMTPECLIVVWKWFIKNAVVQDTSAERLELHRKSLEGMPTSFIQHMLKNEAKQFSTLTEYILRDIGMYLGHLFINHHPNIYWTCCQGPRNYVHRNEPLLQGFLDTNYDPPFAPDFEPIHMVSVQASNIINKTCTKFDLYKLYRHWEQWT